MGWLYDWLREIIMIIMLATFVELLLPNNKLQRYVKVVISLVILLTILQPVVRFLLSGTELEVYTASLSRTEAQINQNEMTGLGSIIDNAEQMKKEQEQQTLAVVQREIEEQTRAGLQQELNQEVLEVHAELNISPDGEPRLQRLEAVISNQPTAAVEKEEEKFEPIEVQPVESVDIKVNVGEQTKPKEERVNEEDKQIIEQSLKWLEQQWGLNQEQIHVSVIAENVDHKF
ncbi:stage III sporulation protein AF [Marinicrinis lubricantis]|uniref:Stage III sporulation protein AF n=1 Tax=Marinicrinis lubricantis TaxID=2086470 RepID=A0ABW1IRM9_9BACL